MIQINNKSECCGCGACEQICPKNCITLKDDAEGFSYCTVDVTKCINCHLCEKVCPIINAGTINNNNATEVDAFVALCNDNTLREQSSSGGVFTVLAEQVLSLGGAVYGATFDENFLVHHVRVDNLSDLRLLRGSKYLQSRIEDTYIDAKKQLDIGRFVLYSGTSCQIAGLHGYLRKNYDNLLTIDVLCHGVPSPKVWRKYLHELEKEYGANVSRVVFRNKDNGWKHYLISIDFLNGRQYRKLQSKDSYMNLFLKNICLRPSCHDCKFKGMDRPSDITLGDAWGVQNHSPEMDDDRGTSVVLLHTAKGKEFFKKIKDKISYKQCQLDIALPPSYDSRRSVKPNPNRTKFFNEFSKGQSINSLVKLISPTFLQRITRKAKSIVKKLLRKTH